jgi:HD-GYP domain-containing protein (c-di-GMP phosphodiesterase class II)
MSSAAVVEPPVEGEAFLKAVTELAQRRPVVTSRAIYNERGVKLLEGGVVIDASLYDRLVAHRLKSPLDECVDSEPGVNGEVLRAAVAALVEKAPFFAQMAPPGRMRSMVFEAIEAIPLPRPVAFQLTLLRETRVSQFDHAVQMALLCAHLVREGGAPIHDITVAASAGLLHDLGMLHIDPELLASDKRLSGDQRRPIYAHPLTGSMLVERFHAYPREVSRAILEHHERLDGSGYPRGLAGASLSPLGRLLSLAEVVTAMFDGERLYPEQRVSLLLRLSPRRYDSTLVPSIHRLIRGVPAPVQASTVLVEEALHRLRLQADLLTQLAALTNTEPSDADRGHAAVLSSVGDQAASLQRMLWNAGVTTDQLARLTEDDTRDVGIRIELWALEQEVQWQLRAVANQLRRRWRAAGATPMPLPLPLAAWLEQVSAIEQPGG